MAKTKSTRRRAAHHRKSLSDRTKARTPGQREETLTLEKLRQCLVDPLPADSEQTAVSLDKYKDAVVRYAGPGESGGVWKGDLLALSVVLDRACEAKQPTHSALRIVPVWLLIAVSQLIRDGVHGHWPSPKGRHARQVRRRLEAMKDLIRAHRVLTLRASGTPFETVFSDAAKSLPDHSEETIRDAFSRVASNLKKDLDHYRKIGGCSFHLIASACAYPEPVSPDDILGG